MFVFSLSLTITAYFMPSEGVYPIRYIYIIVFNHVYVCKYKCQVNRGVYAEDKAGQLGSPHTVHENNL